MPPVHQEAEARGPGCVRRAASAAAGRGRASRRPRSGRSQRPPVRPTSLPPVYECLIDCSVMREMREVLLRRRRPHAVRKGRAERPVLAHPGGRHGGQGGARARCGGIPGSRRSGSATSSSPPPPRSATRASRSAATSPSSPASRRPCRASRSTACARARSPRVTAAAGEIALGAADVALAGGVEHMGHHAMGEDVDFNPRFVSERLHRRVGGGDGPDGREPARPLPGDHDASAPTRSRSRRSRRLRRRGRTA